jgi:hypothetical protein
MEKSDFEELGEEIIKEVKGIKIEKDYSNLGLKFNPFPPAGIPRYPFLPPLDPDAKGTIRDFIKSTYSYSTDEKEEFINYAGLAIVGDYGMGKTHVMKYTKMFIEYLNETEKDVFSAATCFIDRPEESPQRVIHHIVEQIGPDTIRKYVWMILIDEFQRDADSFYEKFRSRQQTLLGRKEKWDKLFKEPTKSNYLEFLGKFKEMQGDVKLLQEEAREIIKKKIIMDDTLADRYLSLIFPEKKANTSWEILAGYISAKDLQRKEVKFLNSIVRILRENGFNLLYVFIDEFEDVSKIKGAKLTNYLTTLNTLINNERSWAVITSLNEDALTKIKEESTPLYDRLTSYKVDLKPLDEEGAKQLIVHYLNLARKKEENSISPFSEELIRKALTSSKGNYRSFIRFAHKAIEYAVLNKVKPPLSADVMNKTRDIAI